jgi:hypothetical protein
MRPPSQFLVTIASLVLLVTSATLPGRAAAPQESAPPPLLHHQLDQILDLNVRDGFVYYRALRAERGRLDRYIAGLNVPAAEIGKWSREHQMAYWVNAYNAFVLQTVINNYPIRGRSASYPASSIRQIPGAFDRVSHRAAGRSVTLDAIEKEILPRFKEARLFLALGRGAVGSGRLRSEAFTGDKIAKQLDDIQAEFVSEQRMLRIDRAAETMSVTPIVSWREADFVAAYDPGATGPYAQRSPIERAIIAFVMPHLLPLEKEFVRGNTFKVTYHPFDWKLNDLTGGRR